MEDIVIVMHLFSQSGARCYSATSENLGDDTYPWMVGAITDRKLAGKSFKERGLRKDSGYFFA